MDGLKTLLPYYFIAQTAFLIMKYPTISKAVIGTLLALYWTLPLAFHFIPWVQRLFVFANIIKEESTMYSGETAGFHGACNNEMLLIDPELNIKLGLWHILPKELIQDPMTIMNEEMWEDLLKTSGKPIVIYLHGNSGTRASPNRKLLYGILQSLDYHVIAFDYRGYGDSTYVTPTETGLVADARAVFNHVCDIIGEGAEKRVFIWGHSLGTGVACHMVAELCQVGGEKPAGLILEAPFTSIKDAVWNYALAAKFYGQIPASAFNYILVNPLHKNDMKFESDKHITKINIPILILHAVDDTHLPFHMGKKLYLTAKCTRDSSAKPVIFKKFKKGYGHLSICTSPQLPNLIKRFVTCSVFNIWPSSVNTPGECVEADTNNNHTVS